MKPENMNLEEIILDVVRNIPMKIYDVLSSAWGVIISSCIFICAFLGNRTPLLVYIAIAVAIDALWGLNTARKTKKFIFSKLISKSAIKIAAYVSVYALVALIEKGFISSDFMVTSSMIAAILLTAELWSILGHIAIAYPDWLVVKLLKKYLRGEMAKKLGISEDEMDEILKDKKR